ncbi:MAG: MarR family transcriptional regulator [Dehalococcoidia bacterium]
MTQVKADTPLFEQHIQQFLGARGADADAQAAVFNLDHATMDVLSTMEAIALRPHGLTHAGFVMLMTLWITGPRETRELASVLRVTKGAIVGSVNTLERSGLVRRHRSKTDRRLVTVSLTDAGTDLVTNVQRDWHALEVKVTSGLTIDEQRTLAALCRKMALGARKVRLAHNGVRAPALPDPDLFLPETTILPNKLAKRLKEETHAPAPR